MLTNITLSPTPIPQECEIDSAAVKAIKTIAYSIMLLLALSGNSLVVAVIYRNRDMRTIVNLFILNMSISDLVIPILIIPNRIKQIFLHRNQWIIDGVLGEFFCKFLLFAENTSVIVSILGLLIITVERFYGVVFPLKTQPIRTKKTCYALIAVSWAIGAILCSQFFYTQRLIHKEETPYCIYSWEPLLDTKKTSDILHSTFLVCFTIIPFVTLVALYLPIIVSLRRQNLNQQLASEQRRRRTRQSRRVSLMLATVVGFFLLSWTPVNVYIFLRVFVLENSRPCHLRHFIFSTNFLSYTYLCANPVIYYVFNGKYRKGFHDLLRCRKMKRFCSTNQQMKSQTENDSMFSQTQQDTRSAVFFYRNKATGN